jgi:NAD(P)-dependent dehydrogenase (short-subunit alcohol dehydrogenase family)
MRNSVVVTGAATGIGRACVAKVVAEGGHAFATVRKEADVADLKAAFGSAVTPLVADVTDAAAVRRASDSVRAALGEDTLMGLVNNAGIAVPGPLLHLSAEELREQMEVKLIGVHTTTLAFAPLMGVEPGRIGAPGRIVMISSVAGKNAMPFIGAYAASKHALEGYSEALRRELMLFGIDVIVIGPGSVTTPIWDKAEANGLERYHNTPYGPMVPKAQAYMLSRGRAGLPASDLGDLVWRALTMAKPKTRYAILRNRFFDSTLPNMLPKRVVDGLVARTLGLKPKS